MLPVPTAACVCCLHLTALLLMSLPRHLFAPQLLQDVRELRVSCSLADGHLDLAALVGQLRELGYDCTLKHNNPGEAHPHSNTQQRCHECRCWPAMQCTTQWQALGPQPRPTQRVLHPTTCPAADPNHRHNVQPSCLEKLRHEFIVCLGRADGSLSHW